VEQFYLKNNKELNYMALKELKDLLEKAKIIAVNSSSRRESICEFVCERGEHKYSFTLFATDLGTWIENKQGNFQDISEMLEAIFEHHVNHEDFVHDLFKSFDSPLKRSIGFVCKKCDWKIETDINVLKNSEYYEFLATPKSREKFAQVLSCGYIQNKQSVLDYFNEIKSGFYELKPL
jgi:hypothetical protein